MAAFLGLGRLSDNSFFTHLATGRLIQDTGGIPRVDPYTFTAHGEPWVVQSWLPSWIYAAVEDLAGAGGLRVLVGLSFGVITAIAWRLSRPTQGLLVRVGIVALVLGVGGGLWSERPLLFGLLALGITMVAAEGGLSPRWLLLVGWLWVNSHGTFPLGVVYLAVVLVGTRLDGGPWRLEQRCLAWLSGGILLGALNPLGPRLLVFPAELLQRQDVLKHVTEWQAPAFQSTAERIFLLQLMLVILALVRRPSYRGGLVVVVFTAAALLGARNLTVASLVFVPVLALAWPEVGSLRAAARARAVPLVAALTVALLGLGAVTRLGEQDYDLRGYPTKAIEYLDANDVDLEAVRLAGPERVGNLLEVLDGPGRRVFFDDRFDMFPAQVNDDNLELFSGGPERDEAFRRWDISLVLFEKATPLAELLRLEPEWRVLFQRDDAWVLFCQVGAELGGDLGTC